MLERITRRDERRMGVQGSGTALPMVGSYLLRLSRWVSPFPCTLRFCFKGDTHSLTHWLRTSRKVMDDLPINHGRSVSTFLDNESCPSRCPDERIPESQKSSLARMRKNIPHPPSPQIVMEILSGSSAIVLFLVCRIGCEFLCVTRGDVYFRDTSSILTEGRLGYGQKEEVIESQSLWTDN